MDVKKCTIIREYLIFKTRHNIVHHKCSNIIFDIALYEYNNIFILLGFTFASISVVYA